MNIFTIISLLIYLISVVGYIKVLNKIGKTDSFFNNEGYVVISYLLGIAPLVNTMLLITMLNEQNVKGD